MLKLARAILRISFIAVACCLFFTVGSASEALLEKYCSKCHSNQKSKGDVNFQRVLSSPLNPASRSAWTGAHEQLRNKEMPPDDHPQLTSSEREKLLVWLEGNIQRIDASAPPNPGRPVMRRLTRFEYRNTLRDLLGVEFTFQFDPTTDFPADNPDAGFDTNGGVMSLTQAHLEQYLHVANRVLEKVIIVEGLNGPVTRRFEAKSLSCSGGAALDSGAVIFSDTGVVGGDVIIEQEGDYLVKTVLRCADNNQTRAQMAVVASEREERFTLTRNGKESRLERKIHLKSGPQQVGIAYRFEQANGKTEKLDVSMQGTISLDFLEISGPLGLSADKLPASHKRIIITRPGDGKSRTQAAEEILRAFASRAFRRPATAEEIASYTALFAKCDEEGSSFERSIRPALGAILVSPNFLFRAEPDRVARKDDGSFSLDAWELASRLSYFLWSSLPDEELNTAAASKKLLETAELERQARRMLADSRSSALSQNFATQWLAIRSVENFQPDKKRFGEFGTALRNAVLQEPVMLFQNILNENEPLLQLLTSDYTFANDDLAKLYKVTMPPLPPELHTKEPERRRMRRVELPPDSPRGGVMTMAAVLMASSHPTRTSLVKRGKWVLDQLLGTPPPPPDPNVSPLPESKESEAKLSLRQMVEMHRAEPQCASCHKRMDPIGFALENFDAMGRWRDKDNNKQPLDVRATMPDGTEINGPLALKQLLLTRKDDFTRCLAEKLLTYALGRAPEPFDHRAIQTAVKATAANDYLLTQLIVELVKSYPFRNRSCQPTDAKRLKN